MTKLYYSSTKGVAAFITAFLCNISIECEMMNMDEVEPETASGQKLTELNKAGSLPCLVIEEGNLLHTEVAILNYFADKAGGKISPLAGSILRYISDEYILDIYSGIIQVIDDLGKMGLVETELSSLRGKLARSVEMFDKDLKDCERDFLVGEKFSIADIYLVTAVDRAVTMGVVLNAYPYLTKFKEAMGQRGDLKAATERMSSNPPATVEKLKGKCLPFFCPLGA